MLNQARDNTQAAKRYAGRTLAFMGVYVAINVAAIIGLFDGRAGWTAWLLAVAVALPVLGQIWATLAYLNEADEFVRAVMTKTFVAATGVAFAVFCVWGFAESYADAPHAPGWLIYPLFWAAFGVISPFVRTSR
ncbi:hypothetical protein [Brevundimonas sp. PAMC22021]|jgi:putative oxidoreductase|uniref:hypothetical protein n=1 Tax=Brevundimonas sp. PAMC22021 TaxID=2861285 RepID=UPI001C63B64E|nr:hypothetical protein [Brevundimonas sp. PAMC22021]QYF86095.1 hypothetical protein KY493_09565 [Brevundimonas sp. PAMC22021]